MRNTAVRSLLTAAHAAPPTVRRSASLAEVVAALLATADAHAVYVVDDEHRLLGEITVARLSQFVFLHQIPQATTAAESLELHSVRDAGDLVLPTQGVVGAEDSAARAVHTMLSSRIDRIPVVDRDLRLIGSLDLRDILAWSQRGDPGDEGPTPAPG